MTAAVASANGALLPFGYSVGFNPRTRLYMVRRHGKLVSASQPDHESAVAFAWTHHALHPEIRIAPVEDVDPGPVEWQRCDIRRQLRQHRIDAQTRTG